jgi:hypothetical protein
MNPALRFAPLFSLLLAACDPGMEGAPASPGSGHAAAGRSSTVATSAVAAEAVSAALQETADDGAPLRAESPEHEADAPEPEAGLPEPDENGITTINWDDLLPPGELERLEDIYNTAFVTMEMNHFGGQMPQLGTFNIQQALIGETVRMPGFILPLDYQPGGEIDEFLLVPYFGACIHTPPPPPNQIVYVTMDEPIELEEIWAPVWVTGVLSSRRHLNALGDAAYTLTLTAHEPYEY